jgi:uncharacterized repeat protein (TIGR03943 family)
VRRDVQSLLLAFLGATILRLSVTDEYLSYVKPGMRPFLIASGVVLVLLGAVSVLRDTKDAPADSDQPDDDEHPTPRVTWLLLLPVLLVFVVTPPPLGAFAADRAASAIPEPGEVDLPALPDGDPVSIRVSEYAFRAVWDQGDTLAGRVVQLTGFGSATKEGGWYLNRLSLACCAADARVARVEVVGADDPGVDTWVQVTGRWIPGGGVEDPGAVPLIEASEVVAIDRPTRPYE